MPPERAGLEAQTSWPRLGAVFGELMRYGLCSAAALGADMGVLLFTHHVIGLHYLLAAALGFAVGLIVAYELSVRYAFNQRRLSSPRVEFVGFVVIGMLGLLLTQALLHLLVERANMPVGLAKIPTAGLVFMFNFTARRFALFSARR